MKALNLLIGFSVGAVTGLALGLLFAPDKGDRTRRKVFYVIKKENRAIKNRLKDYKNRMNLRSTPVEMSDNEINRLLNNAYIEAVESNDGEG